MKDRIDTEELNHDLATDDSTTEEIDMLEVLEDCTEDVVLDIIANEPEVMNKLMQLIECYSLDNDGGVGVEFVTTLAEHIKDYS